mmetsp:Transcript_15800/g.40880  ORF Transcript_15800/g.40880 Transcript_15800/m.40880 type:complete len:312 (-) Transcript_15800:286-1221(-)
MPRMTDATLIAVTGVENESFGLAPAAEEVRVAAYGATLIARSSYHARVSLDDCALIAGALREEDLELLIDSTAVYVDRVLDVTTMCHDAQRVYFTENAGGSSALSEAFSMELLNSMLGAKLEKTELELKYFTGTACSSKITDFSIVVDGQAFGVSVTRACRGWPYVEGTIVLEDAVRLLSKKLHGVIDSTRHVSNSSFTKQLLHIFVPDPTVLALLQRAYDLVGAHLRANTVVVLTLCSGAHCGELFMRTTSAPGTALKKKTRVGLGLKSQEHMRHLAASDPCRCPGAAAAFKAFPLAQCALRANKAAAGG